jgi:hypothetical protein
VDKLCTTAEQDVNIQPGAPGAENVPTALHTRPTVFPLDPDRVRRRQQSSFSFSRAIGDSINYY